MPYLVELMDDPYDAVRIIASRSRAAIPGVERSAFDPLASPDERAARARSLREDATRRPISPSPGEATLFDAHGQLREGEIARLRARRDDRPLVLAE